MNAGATLSHRARQRDATTDLILEAVGRCLQDVEQSDLTFTQVARAAGVGERTI